MTTINSTAINNSIIFRTKFSKLLDANTRPFVTAAFKQFCNFDSQTTIARDILWDLTYSESSSLDALKQLGLNLEIVSPENTLKFRDELRYQYEKLYVGYLTSYVSKEYISAFNILSQKTDSIIASVIYDAIMYYLRFGDINRTLFLLNSDKENFFYGGIRELGFSAVEAEYLKPYHMQIYDFLKSIYDLNLLTQQHSPNAQQEKSDNHHKISESNLPFDLEEITETVNSSHKEEFDKIASNYRRVTAENIIMHRDIFTSFIHSNDLNILPSIANLGFDLNEVMTKKENIRNLIVAIGEKEQADAKLFDAHNNLNF